MKVELTTIELKALELKDINNFLALIGVILTAVLMIKNVQV